MILTGVAFATGALAWSPNSVAFTVGQVVHELPHAMVLHLVLAFPDGRLVDRGERSVVAAAYVTATVLPLARLLAGDHSSRNLLGVADAPELVDVIGTAQFVVLSGCALLGAVLVVRRWRRRRRVAWHWFSLLVVGGALALTAIAALDEVLAWGGSSTRAADPLRWAVLVMLCVAPTALIAGVLEARLARAAVGDVLSGLQTQPSPAALRDALARTLHDPSVELLLRLPEQGGWSGSDGRPAWLPTSGDERAVTLLHGVTGPVGAIVHDTSLGAEPALLQAVSAAAAISLENGRLHAALRGRVLELTASRQRVVEAGQRERKRPERNLHDGAQQRLVTLCLEVDLLTGRMHDPVAVQQLQQIKAEITRALEELRAVARGIHPAILSGHGLAVALETLIAEFGLPTDLVMELDSRPPEAVEVVAYLVVREGLENTARHAEAASVRLRVSRSIGPEDSLLVDVVDDGVGGADPRDGAGLRDLIDRVEALGGTLRIRSPSGSGTSLRAVIPCRSSALAATPS
jgi:signal transduction histidine kinase